MDPDGYFLNILLQASASIIQPEFTFSVGLIIELVVLILLLFASGFVSGTETAFFAISPAQFFELKDAEEGRQKVVYRLLEKPKHLLATLLIAINFVNIAIVVLSSLILDEIFNFSEHELLGFLIQVVAVTFIIVLFCEVMPKVYATQNPMRSSLKSAYPVFVLNKILNPLSSLLVLSTSLVDKRMGQKGYDVSMDELTHAIDVTSDKSTPEDEKKILKGIARFGNIDAKQIMKPRMDVVSFDKTLKFSELFPLIVENRYSRVPVYEGSFDRVIGVLCIKDLLPFLDKKNDPDFDWLPLIRPAYFVPESKKINDLLQEFQDLKNHLAIVIDEYGGSSGIVTLEDVLEEIVGEINDEFDEEEMFYSRLDSKNFVFEGKTKLIDIARIMEVERHLFEADDDNNADTLAGLLLSLKGSIPQRFDVFKHNDVTFTIESADRKKIKRVKITLPDKRGDNETSTPNFSGMSPLVIIILMGFSFLFSGCEKNYIPKQRAYFRISFPEKKYQEINPVDCPYGFEMPTYSLAIADTEKEAEKCWYNIEFPEFKGTLYLSYKSVNNDLKKYVEDSRTLSMKHISRASGLDEEAISYTEKRVFGTIYHFKGNAASPIQFYLTDSTSHFIRGALYFYAVPNPDSIAPVLKFVSADVIHLMETFHWK